MELIWRQEEEIATTAADLLLPEETRRTLGDLQDGYGPGRTT